MSDEPLDAAVIDLIGWWDDHHDEAAPVSHKAFRESEPVSRGAAHV